MFGGLFRVKTYLMLLEGISTKSMIQILSWLSIGNMACISLMLQVLGLFQDLRVLLIRIQNSWVLLWIYSTAIINVSAFTHSYWLQHVAAAYFRWSLLKVGIDWSFMGKLDIGMPFFQILLNKLHTINMQQARPFFVEIWLDKIVEMLAFLAFLFDIIDLKRLVY